MAETGSATSRGAPSFILPVSIGLGYLAFAQAIRFLAPEGFEGPVFWPAAGLALGALLITDTRRWAVILVAVAVGETTSNLLMGLALLPSLGWALANVAHPLVAAWSIRRLHPDFALASLPQLGAFVVFGGVIGPLLSATIGTATGVLAFGRTWAGFASWWVGDGVGALVIAPLFIAWRRRASRRMSTELILTVSVLLVASLLVFRNWQGELDPILPYLVIPPLVWCALRFEVPGAAIGIAIVGLIGGWSTSVGYGPFTVTTGSARVLFEIYLLVVVATALLVAVLRTNLVEREELFVAAERRRQIVEQLNEELGRAVRARDQLVSMVSHELRGPLTPILGFAAALERSAADGGLDGEQRGAVAAIQRNAGRMVSLIDELLMSARVAAGELTAAPQPVEVEVADHGPGVAPEVRPVMFERFTQAVGTGAYQPGAGVGLGLAIVKLLAEANGGSVAYQPPDSRGPGRFVLSFPSGAGRPDDGVPC